MQARRVLINALQDKADGFGISTMIRELFSEYARIAGRACEVIVSRDNRGAYGGDRTKLIRLPIGDDENLKRSLFLSLRMGRAYCKGAVLLTSDAQIPLLLPRSTRLYSVVTDLSMFRRPGDYRRSRVVLWRMQYRFLKRRAEGLFAISEFTKREMVEILRIPAEKIQVVPCACPAEMHRVDDASRVRRVREKYGLPERYALFVGNDNPRKNLENLISAFAEFRKKAGCAHALVIAGGASRREDILQMVERLDSGGIYMIDYVSREELPELYTGADAFFYLSLYEGFGIPILEAQRCGTPVLAARGSSLQEAGGAGALYVNPRAVDEIANGMERILTDEALRGELIRRGYENERKFSWKRSAQMIRDGIEKGNGNGDGEVL